MLEKLIAICLVAVSVAATIEIITATINTYPLAATVAVIIFVAGGFYRVRNEYKRRNRKIPRTYPE